MSVIWQPKPSSLFIDMLSMTLDIPKHQRQEVINNFEHVLPGFMGGKPHKSKLYLFNIKKYLGEGTVVFQCGPKAKNTNFFRVEWNPANVETEAVADLVNLILPGGYSDLIHYGRITRIDITTDVKKLKMEDLLALYPGMSIGYNYLKAGKIQIAYLGAEGSENQFKFYDKVQEVKSSNTTKPKQYKKPLPEHPTTRIEWEYRPQKICTFANIDENCKPIYKRLKCCKLATFNEAPKTDFESFVNTAIRLSRYETLQQALYAIPKHRRKEVGNYILSNSNGSWWKPENLWLTFPSAIEAIVNPLTNKFIITE